MSTYKKCQIIRDFILRTATEIIVYDWDAEFSKKELLNIVEACKINNIDPYDLTRAEMLDLGFGVWSKKNPMLLIPLWLYPFLVEEITVGCLNGDKIKIKKSEIDTDSRFGMLAYGVYPQKFRKFYELIQLFRKMFSRLLYWQSSSDRR
jgi:hypothetical protein